MKKESTGLVVKAMLADVSRQAEASLPDCPICGHPARVVEFKCADGTAAFYLECRPLPELCPSIGTLAPAACCDRAHLERAWRENVAASQVRIDIGWAEFKAAGGSWELWRRLATMPFDKTNAQQ